MNANRRLRLIRACDTGVMALNQPTIWLGGDAKEVYFQQLSFCKRLLHEVQTYSTLALDQPEEARERLINFLENVE